MGWERGERDAFLLHLALLLPEQTLSLLLLLLLLLSSFVLWCQKVPLSNGPADSLVRGGEEKEEEEELGTELADPGRRRRGRWRNWKSLQRRRWCGGRRHLCFRKRLRETGFAFSLDQREALVNRGAVRLAGGRARARAVISYSEGKYWLALDQGPKKRAESNGDDELGWERNGNIH